MDPRAVSLLRVPLSNRSFDFACQAQDPAEVKTTAITEPNKPERKAMRPIRTALITWEMPTRAPFQRRKEWLERFNMTEPIRSDYFLWSQQDADAVRITPDSAAWFDWLEDLTSFDFEGEQGDFLAQKNPAQMPERAPSWTAFRQWGGRSSQRDLGETSHLSIAHLEEIARQFEEEIDPKDATGTGEGDLCVSFYPVSLVWKRMEGRRQWKHFRRRTYRCSI